MTKSKEDFTKAVLRESAGYRLHPPSDLWKGISHKLDKRAGWTIPLWLKILTPLSASFAALTLLLWPSAEVFQAKVGTPAEVHFVVTSPSSRGIRNVEITLPETIRHETAPDSKGSKLTLALSRAPEGNSAQAGLTVTWDDSSQTAKVSFSLVGREKGRHQVHYRLLDERGVAVEEGNLSLSFQE